jgi:MFS transporter, FHS family, glucose/mannose:H+ symporter
MADSGKAMLTTEPAAYGPGKRHRLLTPTAVAHAAFIPTGIVTVLLGPVLPTLSARWGLSDAQAGEFFTAQFLASTLGVAVSGALVPKVGYRLALVLGLIFMAAGVGFLPVGSRTVGLAAVACYGIGLGLTIPTCNLLVAEVNPATRAASLSLLNFSWSVGAMACPFLLAPFQHTGRVTIFFYSVAAFVLVVSLLLAGVSLPRAQQSDNASTGAQPLLQMLLTPTAIVLGILFFVYVGTENAVGGWLASYAKRIMNANGTLWVTTPSYFYGGLLAGRALAPLLLKRVPEIHVVRLSVATAILGLIVLLSSQSVLWILVSATVIGLGLAAIYPITISLLSSSFGSEATRLGSVMFMLASFGAATLPWVVGWISTKTSSLQFGLAIPLLSCVLMLGLYSRRWHIASAA